jgi:uncharacterized protein YueI
MDLYINITQVPKQIPRQIPRATHLLMCIVLCTYNVYFYIKMAKVNHNQGSVIHMIDVHTPTRYIT